MKTLNLRMMKKVLIIKEPELKITTQVSWLNSARYEEGEGFIRLSFAPEMHPFLLNLKRTNLINVIVLFIIIISSNNLV